MPDLENLAVDHVAPEQLDYGQLDFGRLYSEALAEWPAALQFPVRLSAAGHQVDGLADLERSISSRWSHDPRAILMRTLHWNILRAVHLAFADDDMVEPAALPSVRARFEEDVRILATSLHVSDADRAVLRAYLAARAAEEPSTPGLAAMRRPDVLQARIDSMRFA